MRVHNGKIIRHLYTQDTVENTVGSEYSLIAKNYNALITSHLTINVYALSYYV